MRSKRLRDENNTNGLLYSKLKETGGSILKTFSKKGKSKVGQLKNPPSRYQFDHTVALQPIIEEGVENSLINWSDLREKAKMSKEKLEKVL